MPREFWKIVVSATPGTQKVKALAFILSQASLIADLPFEEFVAGQSDPLERGAFESDSHAVPLGSAADIIM